MRARFAAAALPITMLAIALTDSVELSAQDGLPLVKATEQLCAEFYVVGPCWMLVRPDGHVAAALPATPEESAVRAALSRCGRLLDEERYLVRHLRGYADYQQTVRARLVPGVW